MDTSKVVREIVRNPEDTDILHTFLKDWKTPRTGLTGTPILITLGKELAKELDKRQEKLEPIKKLWNAGGRDEKLIAIFALEKFVKSMPDRVYPLVLDLAGDIDNWEICDQLALKVTVFLLMKLGNQMWITLSEWKNSKNHWLRRLAVATIPPYIRRKPEESQRCLNFLESVMMDDVREVKKALSWALREISKKDPVSAFEFMRKWKSKVPSIVKAGMKKLPPELQESLSNGI